MAVAAAELIPLLDALRAAEQAGAEALARWAATCRDPRLRGGLRVLSARDRGHAALAEARLRALGGVPAAKSSRDLDAVCDVVADPAVSDASKLALLVERLAANVDGTVTRVTETSAGDAETHGLLAAIGAEDLASYRWLRAMRDALDGAS